MGGSYRPTESTDGRAGTSQLPQEFAAFRQRGAMGLRDFSKITRLIFLQTKETFTENYFQMKTFDVQ